MKTLSNIWRITLVVGTALLFVWLGLRALEPAASVASAKAPVGETPSNQLSQPSHQLNTIASNATTVTAVADKKTSSRTMALYCEKTLTASQLKDAAKQFADSTPGLGLSSNDIELILEGIFDIGRSTAEPYIDYDIQTELVTAAGRFNQQPIGVVASAAAQGDVEASVIYGTYLLHESYRQRGAETFQFNVLQFSQGEQLLLAAYRQGRTEAAYRLYMHYLFASLRAWRRSGESQEWHELHSGFLAHNRWQQLHGSPGRAMLMQNDYLAEPTTNSEGDAIPNGDRYPPSTVNTKLQQLTLDMPMPTPSVEHIAQREQLLWLTRRGDVERLLAVWQRKCSAN